MSENLKIGLIGLDTSHVTAFTRLLHDTSDPNQVPGGRVVAGFPGGNPHWDKSADRLDKFTGELRDDHGVAILDGPEAVAHAADLVFITAVDGRQHRALFERIAPVGKPTFIDKPFAPTTADAQAMLELARQHEVPLMSCSALRYADVFQEALWDESLGPIAGVDVFGPMKLESALPGLLWYGCHGVEMMVAAMGPGCVEVRSLATASTDVHTMRWDDGRLAGYRGMREAGHGFGLTIHRAKGSQRVDISAGRRPYYCGLLEAVMRSLPQGRSDVPEQQMLEIVRIMEAGNEAREHGRPVEFAALTH